MQVDQINVKGCKIIEFGGEVIVTGAERCVQTEKSAAVSRSRTTRKSRKASDGQRLGSRCGVWSAQVVC